MRAASLEVFVGLDVGTSSVKALASTADGAVLGVELADYPSSAPGLGWVEQHPDDWWAATCAATRRLVANPSLADCRIMAVGLTGQMHGATLLDAAARVLRPSLIWADARGTEELTGSAGRIAPSNLLAVTGSLPYTSATLAKLLWIRAHEPDVYARTAHVLLAKDELRRRLTGVYATDPSDASGTQLFDIHEGAWSSSILAALDLDRAPLPPVYASTAVTGSVSQSAAAATGLPAGIPVAAGGGDAECAAFGLGLGDPLGAGIAGDALVSIGSAGQIFALIDAPQVDPAGRVQTFRHVMPSTWHLMGAILSGGRTLTWLAGVAGASDVAKLLMQAETAPPGAHGLLFLPHLAGVRGPQPSAGARAAYAGLTASHTRADLARAAVEGVAFALRDSLETFHALGHTPTRLLLTGGAAQSTLWPRVLADVLGQPLATGAVEHGSALGAARLAAYALGAARALATPRLTITVPDAAAIERYERCYALYRALDTALRSVDDACIRRGESDDAR